MSTCPKCGSFVRDGLCDSQGRMWCAICLVVVLGEWRSVKYKSDTATEIYVTPMALPAPKKAR